MSSIRIVEMPDLGAVTDATSFVGERAGSGRFTATALRRYLDSAVGCSTNVRDLGAVGDGIHDDTAAIQAALDQGGAICVPPGTYLVTAGLVATKQHIMTGAGVASVITLANTAPATVDVLTWRPSGSGAGTGEGWTLRDIFITGTTNRHALLIDLSAPGAYMSHSLINNVYLNAGTAGRAIALQNSHVDGYFTSEISNCTLTGGIQLYNAGDSLIVRGNTITGANTGVAMSSMPGAACCVIEDNNITTTGGAVVLTNANQTKVNRNQIEQNVAYTGTDNGSVLLLNCSGCSVEDNNINSGNAGALGGGFSCVVLEGGSTLNKVSRNSMIRTTAGPSNHHVNIGPTTPSNYIGADNLYEGGAGFGSIVAQSPTFGVFNQLTLASSWVADVTSGLRNGLFWTRDVSGRATLSGAIRNGVTSAGVLISTLPATAAPSVSTRVPVWVSTGSAWTGGMVRVQSDGQILIDGFALAGNLIVQFECSWMAL